MNNLKFRTYNWMIMNYDNVVVSDWKWYEDYRAFEDWRASNVVMQYIWLKDKNWKEIYEGDIVWDWNNIAWIDNYSKVEYDEEFSGFIVYTPWLITPLHEALEDWNCTDSKTGKDISWVYVVWNIYENPNLIEND